MRPEASLAGTKVVNTGSTTTGAGAVCALAALKAASMIRDRVLGIGLTSFPHSIRQGGPGAWADGLRRTDSRPAATLAGVETAPLLGVEQGQVEGRRDNLSGVRFPQPGSIGQYIGGGNLVRAQAREQVLPAGREQIVERTNSVPRPPHAEEFADQELLIPGLQMLTHSRADPR